jgi:excisionase family DNA binding protein
MPRTKSQPAKKPAPKIAMSNGTSEPLDVLTLAEAAAYLRVTTDEVLREIDTGELPARKFGDEWRFYKAALQEWLSHPPRRRGLLRHAGVIKDDPHVEEMLRDIYARRGRTETGEK